MGEEAVVVEVESSDSFTLNIMERLLSLRVLLVEADDSSRTIITALLRKCGYKVAAASDGIEAWETLKGRPHDIDLVLTEVELPSISGISLLSLIMEHDPCKNIPVIMMSTQDSVYTVFKCMSKGAADYLLKPVRKNELRNLWQHVWRRRFLSDGGRDCNGGKSVQRKFKAIDERNSVTKFPSDILELQKENKECSEKGCDVESSCTKPGMEAEHAYTCKTKAYLLPECLHLSPPDGMRTSGRNECFNSSRRLLMHENEEDESSRPEVQAALSNQSILWTKLFDEAHGLPRKLSLDKDVAVEPHFDDAGIRYETNNDSNEHLGSVEVIDLIGAFDRQSYNTCGSELLSNDSETQCFSNEDGRMFNCTPQLEFSLMGSNPSGCEILHTDDGKTLNHSDTSAFSWYIESAMHGNLPSESKERTNISFKSPSNGTPITNAGGPPWCGANLKGNLETSLLVGQPCQAEAAFPCPQIGLISVAVSSISHCYDAGCASFFSAQSYLQPEHSSNSLTWQESALNLVSPHQSNNPQIYQHCLVDHSANRSTEPAIHEPLDSECKDHQRHMSRATAQSATSSLCSSTLSHLNGSGCGSVCSDSNGNVNALAVTENECEKGLLNSNGASEIESQHSTSREVALTKYRLKRKDRCFEKKVRYQSRKRLAEQRPRVKGQFIRQRPS